jgi:hypothetical protein
MESGSSDDTTDRIFESPHLTAKRLNFNDCGYDFTSTLCLDKPRYLLLEKAREKDLEKLDSVGYPGIVCLMSGYVYKYSV